VVIEIMLESFFTASNREESAIRNFKAAQMVRHPPKSVASPPRAWPGCPAFRELDLQPSESRDN